MVIAGLIIALLPAVICALALAALRAWRPDSDASLHWGAPLAVTAGFVAAQTMIDGAPRIPPIEASGWFSIFAVTLALFVLVLRSRVPAKLWAVASFVVAMAIVVVIVHPLIGESWPLPVAIAWIAGMTAVAGSVAWLVDRRAPAGPGAPAVLLVAATGIAAGLTLCGSARYGQLAGAIASAMGPLLLLGFVRRDARVVEGAAWVASLILAMLVIAGVAYVDVPVFVGLLVAIAPLAVLAGELPMLASGSFWKRDGARVIAAIAIVALALGVAAATATRSAPY